MRLFILPLLALFLASLPYYAYSYCVYNSHEDDTYMDVRQVGVAVFSAFHKQIYPGGKGCCPYTIYDCNPNGNTGDELVELVINRSNAEHVLTRFMITVPSGGWVVVDGDKEHFTMTAKYADGTDFPITVRSS